MKVVRASAEVGGAGRLFALVALALLVARPAFAAETCQSGGCHAKVGKGKVKHEALEAGGCAGCHASSAPTDAAAKCASGQVYKLTQEDPALCTECHDVAQKTPMHGAITVGGCVTCHDPHGNDNKRMLKEPTVDGMCSTCHDEGKGVNLHEAVASEGCTGCHSPHSGQDRPLLKKAAAELCEDCHPSDGLFGKDRYRHAPVAEKGCTSCHTPHHSAYKPLLKKPLNEGCLGCHAKKAAESKVMPSFRIDLERPFVHEALKDGSCSDCHKAHSSKYQMLLRKSQPALCHDCHERKDKDEFVHSAVRLGQCSSCHEPHAAPREKLQRFESATASCFACHSDDLTGRAKVHLPAKTECGACHRPHGSLNKRNLVKPGKALCYGCHNVIDEAAVRHAVIDKIGCSACHDPHGTASQRMLIKPINALCSSCHPNQASGRHVPGVPGADGHVLTGVADPRRDGQEFSCVSCHGPHGAPFGKLMRAGGDGMAVCAYCHFAGSSPTGAPAGQSASLKGESVDAVKVQ